jgi:PAS domain S-box-containing protein
VPAEESSVVKSSAFHVVRRPDAEPVHPLDDSTGAGKELDNLWQRVESLQRQIRSVQKAPAVDMERALRDSRERLELALGAARIGDWAWEWSCDVVTWSPRFAEIHGLPSDCSGRGLAGFLRAIHPDDRANAKQKLQDARQTTEPFRVTYRVCRTDGRIRWVRCNGRVLTGEDRDPARIHGVCLDVTDTKWAERYRDAEHDNRHLIERAEPILGEIAEALAALPPRLSRQIAPLLGKVQTVVRQVKAISQAMGHEFRRPVGATGSALAAKLDQCEPALATWFREAAFLVNDDAISVSVTYQLQSEPFWANQSVVLEALRNLLSNAVRALETRNRPPYQIILQAQLRLLPELKIKAGLPEYVVVSVADTGNGIPPEIRERIFRGLLADLESDHGRGSRIVRNAMDLHHGLIRVASSEGMGSLVELWFPRLVDPTRRAFRGQLTQYRRIQDEIGAITWMPESVLIDFLNPISHQSPGRGRNFNGSTPRGR